MRTQYLMGISLAVALAGSFACEQSPQEKDATKSTTPPPATIEPATPQEPAKPIMPPMKPYQNAEHAFSIEFPANWQYEPASKLYVVQAVGQPTHQGDTFLENAFVTVADLSKVVPGNTDEDAQTWQVARFVALLRNQAKGKIGASEAMTVDGQRCIWLIFEHELGAVPCKAIRYYFIRNLISYELNCYATPETFDAHRDLFDQIAMSFRYE